MFDSYYKHPLYRLEDKKKYRERWFDPATNMENESYKAILKMIEEGAGKHFLNIPFYRGELPVLEDDLDLKGFKFWKLETDFSDGGDNFRGIDFSYGDFMHCHFKEAVFQSATMNFATLYSCTFEDCVFIPTTFLGSTFEKCRFINCDFPERCSFENVTFINSEFDGCFLGATTPFRECFFDDQTYVKNRKPHSIHFGERLSTPAAALSGYFASFQAAYEAAGAEELAEIFRWEARKAFTRYNQIGWRRAVSLFNEAITGYGSRPLRPLIAMAFVYALSTLLFSLAMPLKESIVFTAGAFFTFGAASEHLKDFSYAGRLVYVGLSFCGIILSALFVTSLANLWFRSRVPAQTIAKAKD